MSLKVVAFESLDVLRCFVCVVTVTVSVVICEIFSVQEWRDIER